MSKIPSSALFVPGISAALVSAEGFAGGGAVTALTPEQRRFAAMHAVAKGRLGAFGDALKAKADLSAEPLNRMLAEAGFDIRLSGWPDDGHHFGAVSILNAGVAWIEEGRPTKIRLHCGRGDEVDAFTLERKIGIKASKYRNDETHPLLVIPTTRDGEHVAIHRTDSQHNGLDLFDATEALVAETRTPRPWNWARPETFNIPMVDLDVRPDLGFLAGMGFGDSEITQAIQQVKFGMNHMGARAKVGTGVGARVCSIPRSYTVDGPFMVAIIRTAANGDLVPIFSAFIGDADFKAPSESFVAKG
jgi:hypothetical protein